MSGYFITFEGGEGSGKTTQINRLAEALTARGRKVITTREPGGTPESEKIRNLLVQRGGGDWDAVSECLLLFAARRMHVEKIIRPALETGKVVISDRFADSTLAYQGYGRGMDLGQISDISRITLDDFAPDRTFLLDIPAEEGLERSERRLAAETLQINRSEDRFEALDIAFHERLREGFLEIAKQNKDRCRVIDARQSPEQITKKILDIVLEDIA